MITRQYTCGCGVTLLDSSDEALDRELKAHRSDSEIHEDWYCDKYGIQR